MKVTQIRYKSGSLGWKADLGYINEKRVVRFFPTKEDADNYLREVARLAEPAVPVFK